MKITTILDQIDLGSMALPEFQRGYVWNRDQVRSLMRGLYFLLDDETFEFYMPSKMKGNPHPMLLVLPVILPGYEN
ncbi:MAG TPA: hypothetical protein GXX19_04935 [Syntrophomonadaceae bacterium]|nr:hypothetical protein [Syntrophomonadaceae bacterium]